MNNDATPAANWIVTAELNAAPGREPALAARLRELIGPMRSQPAEIGLLRYDLGEDTERPGRFLLYEEWLDQAHFQDFHRSRQPMILQRFFADAGHLLASAPVIRNFHPLRPAAAA